MNQKDVKLLWGRSGNRCAICRIVLSQDGTTYNSSFTLGEQAHIVGESSNAARGKSHLSAEERETYHNRILLCPNHHTEIDKNESEFSVEKLYYLKSTHELWVHETLSDSSDRTILAKQIAVASIIDAAVDLCQLRDWKSWTASALAPDPYWNTILPETIFEFAQRVAAAIWPDEFEELQRATLTLSTLTDRAKSKFMQHATYEGGSYRAVKFYKNGGNYNPHYDRDLLLYHKWLEDCYMLVHDATRAANWFAEVVRRDINPMFFAETGKFVIIDGPLPPTLYYEASIPEFSEEQKKDLPSSLSSDTRK